MSSTEVVLLLLFHSHEPLRYVRSHVAIVASPPSPIPCRAVCSLASLLVEPDPAEPAQHLLASHCLAAFLPASSQPLEPLSEAPLLCCRAVPSAASRRRVLCLCDRPLNPSCLAGACTPPSERSPTTTPGIPARARSSTSVRPGVREARPRSTPATVPTPFAVIRSPKVEENQNHLNSFLKSCLN